jgi:phosphoribosylanthranilate isomerase
MSIKVKICGITNEEDAVWAVNLGASFIGFNFWEQSPRKVSIKNAQHMAVKLPPLIHTVGVFVDEEIEALKRIMKKTGLHIAQLHGSESLEYVEQVRNAGFGVIKVFRISEGFDIESMRSFVDMAEYFLLDAYREDLPGGTGQTFNWDDAVKIKTLQKPFFLSGGLTPANVTEAVEKVMPYGVDVCSGVEKSPRRKDYDKLKNFMLQVQAT